MGDGKHFSAEAEAEVLNRSFIEAMQRDGKKQKQIAENLARLEKAEAELDALRLKCGDLEATIIQTAYQLGMDRDKALELIEGHENWKALPRYAEGALTHSRASDLVGDLQAERESHRKTKVALERAREWMSGEGHNASCRSVQTPDSTDPCSCGYTAAMKDETEENENAGK